MTKNRAKIRAAIFRHATQGKFLTYGDFASELGLLAQGLSDDLNTIWREESANGYPDITIILHNVGGYPSQIDGANSKTPTPDQKSRAREKAQEVIDLYCPGHANPY